MCPRSGLLLLLVFACVLLPDVLAEDDVEEMIVTPSSCGGDGYGYIESVELEDIEVLCDVIAGLVLYAKQHHFKEEIMAF